MEKMDDDGNGAARRARPATFNATRFPAARKSWMAELW